MLLGILFLIVPSALPSRGLVSVALGNIFQALGLPLPAALESRPQEKGWSTRDAGVIRQASQRELRGQAGRQP